jgi:N-acetylneuraminic acid mutarotase
MKLSSLFRTLPLLAGLSWGQSPSWQEAAPMNTGRSETRAVVIDDKFYVVAGFNSAGLQLQSLEVYNPVTNTWTTRAPAPRGMDHHMMAAHGGKLYVLKYDSIYVYDPSANSWSARPDSSGQTRNDGTAVTVGDYIYVLGGGPLPIQRYHPPTRRWETRASLQTSRGHVNAVAMNGKIWVLGGRSGSAAFRTVEIYDPATNQVSPGPSMDSVRSGHAAEAIGGKIVVAGGEAPGSPSWRLTHSVEIYDTAAGQWSLLTPPPLGLHGVASAVWNGRFYLLGGATVAASPINTNRVFYLQIGPASALRRPHPSYERSPTAPFLQNRDGRVVLPWNGGHYGLNGRFQTLVSTVPGD